MIIAIALAMALAGPVDTAEAPAAAGPVMASGGYKLVGAIREPDLRQVGFIELDSVKHAGAVWDFWEDWIPSKPLPSDIGPFAYYRRHYVIDCAAGTSQMTIVQEVTAKGKVQGEWPLPDSAADPPAAGTVAAYSVAFFCDGEELPFGRIEYETWDEAKAAADLVFERGLGAIAKP